MSTSVSLACPCEPNSANSSTSCSAESSMSASPACPCVGAGVDDAPPPTTLLRRSATSSDMARLYSDSARSNIPVSAVEWPGAIVLRPDPDPEAAPPALSCVLSERCRLRLPLVVERPGVGPSCTEV